VRSKRVALKIGDAAADGEYSEVYHLFHETEFLWSAGKPLEITSDHLVYVVKRTREPETRCELVIRCSFQEMDRCRNDRVHCHGASGAYI